MKAGPRRSGLRRRAGRLRPRRDPPRRRRASATGRRPEPAPRRAAATAHDRRRSAPSSATGSLDREPGLARAQGPLPRQRARLLLELRQPAAAAPHLRARLHRDPARTATRRTSSPTSSSSSAASCPGPGSRPRSLESSGVLIASGNLIKKVLFPAEVLPTVTVLANLVALPARPARSCCVFLVVKGKLGLDRAAPAPARSWCSSSSRSASRSSSRRSPCTSATSRTSSATCCTCGSSRRRSSTSTARSPGRAAATVLRLNPMTHVMVAYQQMLFHGHFDHWRGLLPGAAGRRSSRSRSGAFLFDRLRDTLAEEV